MSSSSPLNPRPQDALAGHDAKSGVGALQKAAGVHPGEQHLIERGYVPVRQITGKVVGVWGDAHIRHLDGTVTPLHVGDVVKKGEVVLTAQDGIVQLEAHPTTLLAGASDDVERTITQVGNGDIDVVPAAGPNSGGAAGSLEEGLRVGRDSESVTPASLDFNAPAAPPAAPQVQAVAPLQTAPTANPDTESTAANTPVSFDPRANDTSTSGLTITAVAGHAINPATPVTLPQGTVTMNADGSLTFTPNHGFSGSVSFTYTDASGNGATSTSTVTVNVAAPLDHQPVAVADTFAGTEDHAIAGNLAGNDTPSADGGNTWSLASGAAHGSVTVNADGTFSYAPAAHYSGPDSFTYTITDVDGSTSTATVTLNIAPVPAAVADTVTVGENSPSSGNLAANDTASPDGSSVWSLATGAAHGSVVVHADGTYTYTPAAGFHGTDSFTYTITDAAGSTSTATVTLTVTPATPVAAPDVVAALENAPVSGSLAANDTPVAGEANTWTLSGAPSHGTVVVNTDGTYTYTPAPGFAGTDSFTYAVTDGSGQASTATVTLSVAPAQVTASAGSGSVAENGSVSGSVAGDASSVPGDANTFGLGDTHPAHGTVVVNADGSYTYTPTTGYSGTDTFSYVVTDASGATSTATVTLTVTPLSVSAKADTNAGSENSAISGSVAADANAVAGDPNTFSLGATHPAHGSVVVNADGSYTYTPAAGYSGTDAFSYVVTDASGASSTATITLTVNPTPITASPDHATLNENDTVSGNLGGDATVVAGDPNTFKLGTGPAHGTVTVNADGTYTYAPAVGYSGPDSFTYVVTDHSGQTSTATVTLSVTPLAFTAAPDSNSGNENSPISGTVAGDVTQVAGDPSTFKLGTGPAHGTVVVNADGSYTYTPAAGYSGTDHFTYVATDASGQTSTSTVTLTVLPLAVTANADAKSGVENSPISGTVAGDASNVAGDANTFSLGATHPAHGTVVVNADGSYTYTPTTGYSGTDSFSYVVTDASGATSTATVSLTVNALPVTATADAKSGVENSPISGTVAGDVTQVAGDPNTFKLGTGPAHGTVVVNADGSYTYTPAAGYSGTDHFTYVATDASGQTSTSTVTLTVLPLAVTANADAKSGVENSPISGTVAGDASTVAGDANTFSLGVTHPSHGSVVVNADGSYAYTPTTGYSGTDSFSYVVTDASGATSTATVTLTVNALPVTATADAKSGVENSPISGTVAGDASNVAGDANTFSLGTTHPSHGSVVVNADGSYTYTPTTGYSGTDSFSYVVTDASGATSTATVTLTVTPLPIAAKDDTGSSAENGAITGTVAADATAIPGDANTFSLGATHPAHGTVVVNADGSYTYTPTTGYSGTDSFSYVVTDASGATSTATVTLTVTPLPITATADAKTGIENRPISGTLASDATNVAGDPNTFSLGATHPSHGTVVVNADGSYKYTPTTGYSGTDSFSYVVTDASGATSTATVTLTVAPLPITATADAKSGVENSPITGTVAGDASTVTGDANTFSLGATHPSHGSVVVNADGSYTYTPTTGYSGTDSFSYVVTDHSGATSTATVTLTVAPLAISAGPDSKSGNENAPITGSVASDASVVPGDANTFALGGTHPAHGSVVVNADGSYTYTPTNGYVGTDSFSYVVTDASGATSTATVSLSVVALPITAKPDTNSGNENGTITGSLAGDATAIAGDANTFTLGGAHPAHGSVVVNADGSYTYTPTTGYSGTDSFSYVVTDHSGQTSTATVSLTVNPLGYSASPDAKSGNENSPISGSLASDVTQIPGDPSTFSLGTTHPTHGTVVVNAYGSYTYTPTTGYSGTDSFTYVATNASGQVAGATVTLTVNPLPIAATADAKSGVENTTISGSVATDATTIAGDANTFTLGTTHPTHGSVVVNVDGSYTYTPITGYSGTDSFSYIVTDHSGATSTATVTLTVTPAAIAATADSKSGVENTTISGSVASDATTIAGDANTFALGTTHPTHGSVVVNADGSYTYTPSTGYTGTDSFSYIVTDHSGATSTATVTLTVTPAAITATADSKSGVENSTISGSVASDATTIAGDANTFALGATHPTHGSVVVNADGTYTYTPATGYSGSDSFSYIVTDHSGATSTATVTLTVTPLAITATSDTAAGPENSAISGSVASDASTVAGDANTFTLGSTHPAHGSVVVNADGTYTYTPTVGYSGTDSFSYIVTDHSGATSTATVTLTVSPLAITAKNDVASGPENSPISGSVSSDATIIAGDANTFTLGATHPAHGSVVVNADGSYTYTPTTGYSGTDSFSYVVTDHSGATSTATVTLTVTPLAVTAKNDTASGTENAPITGSLASDASTVAGDANTFALGATHPAHGTVVVNTDGTYSYTPTAGYTGTDTFSYVVTDHSGSNSTATVTLTVTPQAITAKNDVASGAENSAISGSVSSDATIVAGDANTFALGATHPAHGSVVVNADGSYTYTPTTGYSGTDSFSYIVTDHSGATSTATVTLTVTPLAITATADSKSGAENSAIGGSLAADASTVAGDANTFTLGSTHPTHGSVVVNADGSYTYTPSNGYTGTDSFSYIVTDHSGATSTATVTLTVTPLPITAKNDSASGQENGTIAGSLAGDATAIAGDANTFTLGGTHPAHGSVVVNADGSYTYTPTTGYSGTDSFSYVVTDHSGQTSTATVSLTVNPLGYSASPDAKSGNENSPISGSLSSDVTQIPGDPSTFSLGATHPAHGTVVVNADGSYTYTPTTGYSGTDSFTYVATNASGQVAGATLTLTVNPLPITATGEAKSVVENGAITGSVASDASTVAGDANTFTLGGTHPAHGSVVVNTDGSYTYTPSTGYIGTDSFSYVVTDHSGATSTATVTLTVTPAAITATADAKSVVENSAITSSVASDASVIAGDANTFTLGATHPTHGTVVVNADGSYTYTPTTGYTGTDSFSYIVTDHSGATSTATVTLTVTPAAITATADSKSGVENTAITGSVASDASVIAGDANTFTLGATHPTHGTVVVNADGSYTYTPTTGYTGTDSFSYIVTDHSGATSTATVTLTVTPAAITATADAKSVVENSAITSSVASDASVVAGDANTFTLGGTHPAHGSVVVNADGSYTYTPTTGYTGTDSFSYIVTDHSGATSTATVTLNVTPAAITATADSKSGVENTAITGSVASDASIVAGDANTFTLGATHPTHGSVVVNADGSYTYTPSTGYTGTDTFSYIVTDHSGATSTATVTLTVTPAAITATADAKSVVENSAITSSVASDASVVAGDANTFTLGATHPTHGSVVVNADGSYTYTPSTGYTGTDSFTYVVTDHSGATSTATVTLTVTPAAITATADSKSGVENTAITGSVASDASTVAGDANTFTLGATHPTHGSVVVNADGSYTYTPSTGYTGTDTFSYVVTDHSGATSTATVTLTVTPAAITAAADSKSVVENSTISASLASDATSVAGDANTFTLGATHPTHGSVVVNADGSYTYTPATGYTGTDTFSYVVTDHSGATSTATVTLTVTPAAITAAADSKSVVENSTISASLASDATTVAGDANTFTLGATHPTHGSVVVNADGSYTYTPTTGYTGTDSFSYVVTDQSGATSTATVTLTVTPAAITAAADSKSVVENSTISASLASDATTIAGDANTFTLGATHPTHGSVVVNADGSYTYTPTTGYTGTDSFSYVVTDHSGATSTATVTLTVTPAAITATADAKSVVENSAITSSVASDASVVAGDANTFTLGGTHPAHGSVVVNADGSYTYTPATGYTGTDSFSYIVTDHSGATSTATVTLTVTPAAITATADAKSVVENSAITSSVASDASAIAGDANTFTLGATHPTHGTVVVNADGSYTYTPTTGYTGTDSFSYIVTDHSGATSTATVTLTVTPAAITATADSKSGVENTTISGSVATDATTVAGDANTFTLGATHPTHGSVVVNADGSYTYTPSIGYTGTDTFSYIVTDHSGATSTSTVTLTVTPATITATADAKSVVENGAITSSVASDATTIAGDANTFTLGATHPTHGSVVVNADGSYTYTPTTGYTGTDTFSYVVTDHSGATSTATVTLTVTPLAITAKNDAASGPENGAISGSVASDAAIVAGDANTFTLGSTHPTHGTVVVNADGTYTYTPTTGYSGTDSFSYVVTDHSGATSTATVTLTVTPLAITAKNDAASGPENSAISGTVASDATTIAGDANTFTLGATHPAHGTVVVNANGSYTYTPATGYSGTDSFSYIVTDHSGATSTATVTLTVTPAAITATADAKSGVENTTINGSVASDATTVAGDANTFSLGATHPTHGSVVVNADGSYTYTPTTGYTGTDSFSYIVTDHSGATSTATVTLTVTPAPITAVADAKSVVENSAITSSVASDASVVAGDANTFTLGTIHPTHGSVVVNADGSYTYTPTTGYTGTDSFSYVVTDHSGATSTATVTLTVTPLAIAAKADTGTGNENAAIAGTLAGDATVIAGDANTFTLGATHPTHGTVVVNTDGTYTYTPTSGYSGSDSFSYVVTDHSGATSTATVTLTVNPINPTANADAFTVTANGPSATLNVKTNDTPVAGETNAWSVKTNPAHGTLTPASDFATSGNFVYTPTAGFTGTDTFTYVITDGSGHTSTATVTLTVAAEKPPVANADTYSTAENTLLVLNGAAGAANHALTTNDTDANGDTLTVTQINGTAIAAGGSVVVTGGTVMEDANGVISFNPTTNYTGNATLTYTISDGHGGTSTANVTISVTAGTDDPTVTAQSLGRWQFNEGTGTSTKDTYNNYTGTLTDLTPAAGGTAPTWVTGHNGTAGTAVNFDGKGGIVSVPLADTAPLTSTGSLSVWFNTTQVGSTIGWSSPSIIGSEHQGDANDIQWGTINNRGQIGLGLGNDPTGVYSTQAVNDGAWHELTITRTVNSDGTSAVSVYIDGVLSNSATLAAQSQIPGGIPANYLAGFGYTNAWQSTTSGGTTTNSDGTTGDVYYKGSLDDAAIYSHALTADQTKAIYLVQNGFENTAVANDGDAIKLAVTDTHATALHVIGLENGMTISDGSGHTVTSTGNSQVIDVTGWTLGSLQLTNVGTGSANLEFDAINTNASTGQSEDTSTYLSVVNGTSLIAGTTGTQTLTATGTTAAYIVAGTGNDTLVGNNADDRLIGGAGNDTITGGNGNDLIEGGAGNNTLTGGGGNDTFRWELADHGTAGTPLVDTINDFSSAAGNKDVLDLRDLLGGENHNGTDPGNIASFLHFDHSGSDTIIHVSTTGGFASGYTSANENETIILKGVDLTSAGTQTDSQIIHQLLTNGQLHLG
ncbi:Ig-like domain-containing protein [Scleromatobacter humisilvae]|uniref:Ig-like domain-containing protein n=1 Tax=Scleromatobacter humisilvae TaxID=2897159 RepID=A0A9X1YP37_9BURK|nr:Ig-like domain-containing protein [Scleromatobacter humisilvae]MCK9689636.1 Ig-like domain-containing protein [Scleromatobacter humisilvae]